MRCFVVPSTGAGLWPATVRGTGCQPDAEAGTAHRGPGEAERPMGARPRPGASGSFVRPQANRGCGWIDARRTTRECGLRRDLRSQTAPARRVFHSRRRGAKPGKASSWVGVTWVKVLCAEWHSRPRRGRARLPTAVGSPVRPVTARITVDVRACRSGRTCRVGAKR